MDNAEKDDPLSTVARAWTLTVLETLTVPETLGVDVQDNGRRKRRVFRFLYEANLIGKKDDNKGELAAVINLSRANLVDADLRRVDLSGAALGEAKLTGTDLRDANLENVRQRGTDPDDEPFITLTNNEIVKKGPILNGATIMPDGQKYEDCCEKIDKASEKNGETLDP